MITQTIKQWLSNLFAWWPWKRTATTAYAPPSRNRAIGVPQEHSWSASGEESLPQTGVRSVVVEQSSDDATSEATLPLCPPSVEQVDMPTQPPSPRDVSALPRLSQDEKPLENPTISGETTPASEQKMAFLRYLVSHGLVNEGFEQGQVPEQYRKKQ